MDSEDERLERRLQGLQPVGPPSSLRARILASAHARPARSLWIWLPAAAALFAAALLNWRTAQEYEALSRPVIDVAEKDREHTIQQLSSTWGGTAASQAMAAAAIDAIRAAAHPHPFVVSPEGLIK
ncbi:MAG: hypothetical protein ABI634_20230 [Acidobacteriota bacterium]